MGVRQLFPIVTSRDLARLIAFYEAALDAVVDYRFGADGQDDYVSLRLGAAALGIGRVAQTPVAGDRIALWFYVDDVDASFAAWTRLGGAVEQSPTDMPWGERVAQVRDPDGNLVNLATPPTG